MTWADALKDDDGYLANLNDWNEDIASGIADEEGIQLTEQHWEIIYLLREFYSEFQLSPAMRPLIKYAEKRLGSNKGKSIYFMQLFPVSPAKIASKIAGLPKPTNCL